MSQKTSTLALWYLAAPMARLLLEMDPEGSNGCCQSCHSEMPIMVGRSVRHRPDCPWSPGGLIDRIRALVPEKEAS